MSKKTLRPIIGLEVHIELSTESKMFCGCSTSYFGAKPNSHTCPVCLGLPGALPYINKRAVEWTILLGLALGCEINSFSKFDRKNYFYPDLAKGYQISQYELPLSKNGKFRVDNESEVNIKRVHLEEDTGKLIHQGTSSLIDFNRSGVPLVEIVTEPDFASAAQAKVFLQKLRQLVRYLGIAQADMEKGQMRCEPNVNLEIKKMGKTYFTPIVEVKNINSFRYVGRAIDYEVKRQSKEFEKTREEKKEGNKQTRGWNENKNETFPQRVKEEEQDYRYFPEPDLPPMRFTKRQIDELRKSLLELPEAKVKRFVSEYNLTQGSAVILVGEREKADYFEKAVGRGKGRVEAKLIANWIVNKKIDITETTPDQLVKLIEQSTQDRVFDQKQLIEIIKRVIKENGAAVSDYKKGKIASLEFLVGQVIRQTKRQADHAQSRQELLVQLESKS